MSVEQQNKAAVSSWVEAWNHRNLEHLDKIYHPEYFDHTTPPGEPNGREAMRQTLVAISAAFPDAREVIHDMVAEGNKLVTRWAVTGTHLGEFLGIQPTGKRVTISGIHIYRMENAQLRELWRTDYMSDLLRQLGDG